MGFLSLLFGQRSAPTPAPPTRNSLNQRGYAGSSAGFPKSTDFGRLESSWSGMPYTADAYIYQHWRTLVARSRAGCEEFDHLRKYKQMVRDNVAGPDGFTLHAQPKDPTGKLDKLAAKAIEDAWNEWSKRGNYDSTGTMSRADGERLAVTTRAVDGEFIAIKRYGELGGPWGFCLQFVDPMLLDNTHYVKLSNGNHIRHGIEFDQTTGRPVAYYFREFDEMLMGYMVYSRGADQYNRIPADRVIHWFVPEILGQKRGLPQTRTALWRMRMLAGFHDAALTNARVSAAKMGVISDPEFENSDEDELPTDAEAGTFMNIGNRTLTKFDSNFPNGETEVFERGMLRSAASSLSVSYNNLASDLTAVNFSSIRQGALDERETWKGDQESFISGVEIPVYESWLEYSLLAQKITVNGKPLKFERLEKYKSVEFSGRRWAWIDPVADMNAAVTAIGQGIRSVSSVIEETTGREAADVWDEMKDDKEEMKKRGIVPLIPPGSAPPMRPAGQETAAHEQPPVKP